MLRHHRDSSFNDDYFKDKIGIYEVEFTYICSFCIPNFFINFFPSS